MRTIDYALRTPVPNSAPAGVGRILQVIEQVAARRNLPELAAEKGHDPQQRDAAVVVEIEDRHPAGEGLDPVSARAVPGEAWLTRRRGGEHRARRKQPDCRASARLVLHNAGRSARGLGRPINRGRPSLRRRRSGRRWLSPGGRRHCAPPSGATPGGVASSGRDDCDRAAGRRTTSVRLSSAPARPGCVRVRASSQASTRAPRRPLRMRATASPRSTRPWRAPLRVRTPRGMFRFEARGAERFTSIAVTGSLMAGSSIFQCQISSHFYIQNTYNILLYIALISSDIYSILYSQWHPTRKT